jgi:hypothetical protein
MNEILLNSRSKLTDFAHTHLFDIQQAKKFLNTDNISILNNNNCFVDSMLLSKVDNPPLSNEGFVNAM